MLGKINFFILLVFCLTAFACAGPKAPFSQQISGTWELAADETIAQSPEMQRAIAIDPDTEAEIREDLEGFLIEFLPGKLLVRNVHDNEDYEFKIISESAPDNSAIVEIDGERMRIAVKGDRLLMLDFDDSDVHDDLTLVFRRAGSR